MKCLGTQLSRLSSLNNKKSQPIEPGLHLTGLQKTQILSLLPDRISRTRFLNTYHLEPLPEIPHYILLPNFLLFQAINDRILDNHESSDYEIIPIDTTIYRFLNSHNFTNNIRHGYYSATDTKNKIRYVTQIPYTVTECAREYIRICEFLSGNKLRPQYSKYRDRIYTSPTHYFSGYHKGELAYIDITAAYWSILWPTAIDMEYDPIKQEITAEGSIAYYHCDQFAKAKIIRNLLSSLYNYKHMKIWKWDEKRNYHFFPPSELYRPYNVAYIYDMINAIVVDAINRGFQIKQWLTDAAILPTHQANSFQEFLFEEWFLDSRLIASGPGYSNITNSYKIGPKTTGGFNPRQVGVEHNKLREANIEGLKELRQLAKNNQLPEIGKSKRQKRMPGSRVALKTAEPSEYIPKKRLIAPKRIIDPMNTRGNSPPPKNTLSFDSAQNILKRYK